MTCKTASTRSNSSSGFTLLEVLVVIALMIIFAGAVQLAFDSVEESPLKEPADKLAVMVKQASRAAVVQGRTVAIGFDKEGFGFLGGVAGSEGHVVLPKGMKVTFQPWNGGKKWLPANDLVWRFYSSGIFETLRFRFVHPEGSVEIAFNPLTGSVSEEAAYLR
jgi:type II secretion system protein H